jgi:class 3 adenylate cyclase
MPEERVERRLVAILAADIVSYSTLMGADEVRTVRDLKGHQAVVLPMVGEFGGRIIDTAGDGILAEFPSVVNAVTCAVAIQSKMAERNAAIETERRMQFRVGINIGEVIYDEARIYGDGINVAARLEGIAESPAASASQAKSTKRSADGLILPMRTSASSSSKTSRGRCESIGYAWMASRQRLPPRSHCPTSRLLQSCHSRT